MAEKQMKHNADCTSQGHPDHLCHLMYEGFHFSNPHEYKAMVQDAQFRCQNCGRTAKKGEHLCVPVAL